METVVGEMDNGMDVDAKLAEGLRLIDQSSLCKNSKKNYCAVWRHWVNWCGDAGVDPLGAGWKDVLECLHSGGGGARFKRFWRPGIAFIYHSKCKESPTHDRRLGSALGKQTQATSDAYSGASRHLMSIYQADYLAWCRLHDRKPGPASGEQMVEFLSTVAHLVPERLSLVNSSVSLYLMEQGHPSMEFHPLVLTALKKFREERSASHVDGGGKRLGILYAQYMEQWVAWRDAQGIVAGAATGADVVEYLRKHDHLRTAGKRLNHLRHTCEGEPAFWSENVQDWLEGFQARLKKGEVPGVRTGRKSVPVLAEWTAARAARARKNVRVPVGLTREEVERGRVGQGPQLEPVTVEGYALSWADFSEWRRVRDISLESVEPMHIRVYLEEATERLRVSSLWNIQVGLAFGLEEHGFLYNPALDDEVVGYLSGLQAERKEAPFQMSPIGEAEFSAILKTAFEPRPRERAGRTEIRGTFTVSLVRMMLDGLLRGGDASRARWGDLSRSGDGTGSLLLPRSKTDKLGRGECTYVSKVALEHLDLLRDLRRFYGKAEREDGRIFGSGVSHLIRFIKEVCAVAGLEGNFGTHSMRIGGAQELARRGFALPMIMLAGRWATPGTVELYIRHIKVQESAMAQLQRMFATGELRLGPEARGIDIMSNYNLVRLVR